MKLRVFFIMKSAANEQKGFQRLATDSLLHKSIIKPFFTVLSIR